MGSDITVIKNDHTGTEMWRYEGVILERTPEHVRLEAHFNRDVVDLGYVTFRRGDRFVEHFYADRWYNVFEVHDGESDRLKGWYCNLTRPAEFHDGIVEADDLALDLFVYPDGRQLVLDEDEFAGLPLNEDERAAVRAALDELRVRAAEGRPPFVQHPE
jgi:predicted RNA-binding protein associated with RNAse of E/G family